jgi:hypothetical protein
VRYGEGSGGTGGMRHCWEAYGVIGSNQKDDFGGMEGWEAAAGLRDDKACCVTVWWVENDHADMEWRLELAFEVIQDEPSRRTSTSSVANDGLDFYATSFAGGQGFKRSSRTARLRLMM